MPQSLAGFGDPVVVVVAALFIVTAGLETTGVAAWIGERLEDLIRPPGESFGPSPGVPRNVAAAPDQAKA